MVVSVQVVHHGKDPEDPLLLLAMTGHPEPAVLAGADSSVAGSHCRQDEQSEAD
jgi:hypothetical protein